MAFDVVLLHLVHGCVFLIILIFYESKVSCEVEGDKKNKEFNLLYFNRSTFDS